MKKLPHPSFRSPAAALLIMTAAAIASTSSFAQEFSLDFSDSKFTESKNPLSRIPDNASPALTTRFAFGPAAPTQGYSGPAFSFGYEVRASVPSDLTVQPQNILVEDNYANGKNKVVDTLLVTSSADWPESGTYSVAAAVVFPTKPFPLARLSYVALNWTQNESYNSKLRHRWLIQTGGKYYVHGDFLGRTGKMSDDGYIPIEAERGVNLSDRWIAYDPAVSLFAALKGPSIALGTALETVTAVGFYMDSIDFSGAGPGNRQWQFRLLSFNAQGFPDGSSQPSKSKKP